MTTGPRFQVWALAGSVFAAVLLAGLFVGWRANRALRLSKEEVRTEHEVRVEMRPYIARANVNFEPVSSPQVFSQFARLNDRLYIAGPAGLAEYDLSGVFLRELLVGRDLPSSPLVAMAAGMLGDATEPELIVATADEGILVLSGRTFRQIHPSDADVRSITTILPGFCWPSFDRHQEARRPSLRWQANQGIAFHVAPSIRPGPCRKRSGPVGRHAESGSAALALRQHGDFRRRARTARPPGPGHQHFGRQDLRGNTARRSGIRSRTIFARAWRRASGHFAAHR